jgi:salicylate 5-hydroxylase small subunit
MVYGITQTIYHGPYSMRHVVSPARVPSDEGGLARAQSNYAVFRTRPGESSQAYNVGRSIDEIVPMKRTAFAQPACVYDSGMAVKSNSPIHPVRGAGGRPRALRHTVDIYN